MLQQSAQNAQSAKAVRRQILAQRSAAIRQSALSATALALTATRLSNQSHVTSGSAALPRYCPEKNNIFFLCPVWPNEESFD